MALFMKTFGVEVDINSFTNLVRKWEGGEHSVKMNNKTIRGLCFKVDYLPLSLVLDIFNLVNISISILKHRKNCECCHHHSLFKGHNVNVNIVVLNCQK